MSDCGNCDCADKSKCVKKGNGYVVEIVETEKRYFDDVADTPAAENGGCKCGAACACTDCKCGK